jgi:hypothetical protein
MKTSLIIEDSLFKAAKEEADRLGKTVSEMISLWARAGREIMRKPPRRSSKLKTVDLGGPSRIDLSSRKEWMEELE